MSFLIGWPCIIYVPRTHLFWGWKTEGGPGKQVTTTGVGPGNISKWKLNFFQKFEFKERGYFGTIKKNDSKIKPQVTPGNAQVTPR